MQKNHIIIIYSYYGVGGAQRRAANLANQFVKHGYSVSIVSLLGRDGSIKDDQYFDLDHRINLVIIPEYYEAHRNERPAVALERKNAIKTSVLRAVRCCTRMFPAVEKKLGNAIRNIRVSESLRAFLMTQPGSVIIHFGFNIFECTWYAARNMGHTVVYAETNASEKYKKDANFEMTKGLIKKADAWVFQTMEQAREHGLADCERAYVIHNPIKAGIPEPYVGERRKAIVNFCRLSPQKNLLLLIKAFQKLLQAHPDYKLEIYGSPADDQTLAYKGMLDDYIQNNQLSESVAILPFAPDVHIKIRDAAMFVSSSDYEGLSNAMIEAMALGLPCICTDCGGGGAREIIRDEENGLLVPIKNEEVIYKAMERLIDDQGLARKLGNAAEMIRDDLSVDQIVQEWEKAISVRN